MTLIHCTYGKGRVRVLRIQRQADRQSVRELTVTVMLEGDFAGAFTQADNTTTVATDTIKNIVHIVAHENSAAETEPFCQAVATRFLERYAQVERLTVLARETRWNRMDIDGAPHPYGFLLDGNGTPTAKLVASRDGAALSSGIEGLTFMKSTGSGWSDYVRTNTRPFRKQAIASAPPAWMQAGTGRRNLPTIHGPMPRCSRPC